MADFSLHIHPKQLLQQKSNTMIDMYNNLEIGPGVYYSQIQLENETLIESAYVLKVDVTNPYTKLRVQSLGGQVGKLGTVREIMNLSNGQQSSSLVMAVNGDFFSHLGIPSGLQMSKGEIISAPKFTRVAMALKRDKSITFPEKTSMCATVHISNEEISIDAINRTKKLNDTNHLFLYNTRFRESTKTPSGGIEIVIALKGENADGLCPEKTVVGHVKSIKTTENTAIKKGFLILSATGSKATWLREHVTIGSEIAINITFNNGINEALEVVSGNSTLGYTLLKDGQINEAILNDADPNHTHRHPRTMLAVKDNLLYVFIIDGRQPGYSDGITMAEGAQYLQNVGMENAINIDGGGSTTCFVRNAGDARPTLVNQPSDGFEREVGNALILTSTAPIKDLNEIVPVQGSQLKLYVGSQLQLKIKGHDKHLNPLPISENDATWSVKGVIGTVSDHGLFYAGYATGTGEVIVQKNNIEKRICIEVVADLFQLKIYPERPVIEPGKTVTFTVRAYDRSGCKVLISPNQLDWEVVGGIGEISDNGQFKSVCTVLEGQVVAQLNGIQAESKVSIGKRPELITGFETIENMVITEHKAIPKSVQLSRVERPNPVRFGRFSGKLTYDFTGMSGTSKATINLLDTQGKKGELVADRPYRFGVWVYGDGNNHWLRLGVADANGETQSLNFTAVGGLNWIGWKYVYADIPKTFAYPIRVLTIYLMELNDANKNSGTIYLDHLRAEYIPLDEDVDGPMFSDYVPKPQQIMKRKNGNIAISISVKDSESGVDPSSIRMWLNNQLIDCTYNPALGKAMSHVHEDDLQSINTLVVEAIDNAGNPSVPKAEWTFSLEQ